jgi:endopeptidase Clp ATP-binding regulatory subunit ClpX
MLTIINPDMALKKNNIIMVGPSGCGKTEIMRVLSKILPVPISFFDSSDVTQSGWKGDKKIKDSVKDLLLKTNNNKTEAEHGIIFLDEFDKMCRPSITAHGENVSVHIQGEVLAMIEGCEVEIDINGEASMMPMKELMNTSGILFVCAGAFDGIEDIVKKERNKTAGIGFNSAMKDTDIQITAKDITKEMLIKFGITPELAGRLTITTALNKLTKEDMLNILTKCEDNVISEIEILLNKGYGCNVIWGDGAFQKIIDLICNDIGARGLRSVVFERFSEIMYDLSMENNVESIKIDNELNYQVIKKKETKKKVKTDNAHE